MAPGMVAKPGLNALIISTSGLAEFSSERQKATSSHRVAAKV
jgi:hypothetical protein